MAAEFALAVVQETLELLDSCQNGDYSGILFKSSTIVAPTIFSIIETDIVFQYFSHTTIIYEFLFKSPLLSIIYSDFTF